MPHPWFQLPVDVAANCGASPELACNIEYQIDHMRGTVLFLDHRTGDIIYRWLDLLMAVRTEDRDVWESIRPELIEAIAYYELKGDYDEQPA